MHRRHFLNRSLVAGVSALTFQPSMLLGTQQGTSDAKQGKATASPPTRPRKVPPPRPIDFKLSLDVPTKLFDGKYSYCHPRAGIVPGAGKNGLPRVVMTMNTIELTGNDVFKTMDGMYTDDLGKTWSKPVPKPGLVYRVEKIDGEERPVAASDFWPTWHKKSKTLLGTGHTVAYETNWKIKDARPRDTSYSAYDPQKDEWAIWQKLEMPADEKFGFAGAGCAQRVDEADGTILLPIYYRSRKETMGREVTVMRCSFDGKKLTFLEHGDEIPSPEVTRGFAEPSLTYFQKRYFLTIRHPKTAYVTRSNDGMRFEPIRVWRFDDGVELGSYETQAHWVTHSDALFLVYTRRTADNGHVFRHRAPLFMAQVDPENLVVIRSTEKELMPNRGARYGNFGVTQVSPDETWVTDSEWMQPLGVEKYGSDGSVFAARIHWAKPNGYFSA